MKRGLIWVLLFVLLPSVYSLEMASQQCFSNGQFIITLESVDSNITYTDQIKIVIDGKEIGGDWDINFMKKDPPDRTRQYATFTSDDGVIFSEKEVIDITYPLELGQIKTVETVEKVLECPPFIFSCALLNMEIDECYTEGDTFKAFFYARGFEQSQDGKLDLNNNLVFNLFTREVYEDIYGKVTSRGSKPRGAIIEKVEGDKYLLTYKFPNENLVDRFRVGFANLDKCLRPEYEKYGLIVNDVNECGVRSHYEDIKTPVIEKQEEVSNSETEEIPESGVGENNNEENSLIPVIVLGLTIIGIILLFKFRKKILKPKK